MYKKYPIVIGLLLTTNIQAQTCNQYITASTPNSEFIDNDDGTVTHTTTGLMWAKCSEGQSGTNCATGSAATMNWNAALNAAENSSLAGYTDWRLPNKNELASLQEKRCYDPAINTTYFPNTPTSDYFWTSSPYFNCVNCSWIVSFSYGYVSSYNRYFNHFVRGVRVGQWLLPLALNKLGTGSGAIISDPVGIACGEICTFPFHTNTVVKLTATATTGSVFAGWGGACSGTNNVCTITMNAAKNATATFNLITAPSAVTNAPSLIVLNRVTLKGTVNPKGAVTAASFEFGKETSPPSPLPLTREGGKETPYSPLLLRRGAGGEVGKETPYSPLQSRGGVGGEVKSFTYEQTIAATPATIAATAAATSVSATATLDCNTTYHYRTKAVNSVGTAYGTDKTFTTTCPAGSTQLTNGVAATNQTITANEWKYYYLSVPAGADTLKFVTSGSGDIDIYAQVNALPTDSFACSSENGGSIETCQPITTTAGTWWLGVYAYEDSTFSLTASFRQTQTISAISFNPTTLTAGQTTTASATASSGLPVTFTTATPDVCSINGSTVQGLHLGTCTITATQAGDGNYVAATAVSKNITVSKGTQTITITCNPTNITVGTTSNCTAIASSGLTPTVTAAPSSVCTLNGNTLTAATVGTCTVTATQAGNADFLAATTVTTSLPVAKGAQTITLTCNPLSIAVGGTTTCTATASSNLTPSLSIIDPSICTINGSTVTGLVVGICTVKAKQIGNSNYNAATPVTQNITVGDIVIYKVTPSVATGGNVSPDKVQDITQGSTVSFTVTANTGYTTNSAVGGSCPSGSWNTSPLTPLHNWRGEQITPSPDKERAGVRSSTSNIWTTGAIIANCAVNFGFTLNTYTVTATAGSDGTVTSSATNTVKHGATTSFTVNANTDYTIDTAVGGTCPSGSWNGNIWTTGAITTSCSVNFSFTYNPNVSANAWLNPPSPIVKRDRPFTLDVTANSNTMKIASYKFTVTIDPSKLTFDTEYQNIAKTCVFGICPGTYALTSLIVDDTDLNTGTVVLIGQDTQGGKGPGNDLQLVVAHLKTKTVLGTTPVTLITNKLNNPSNGSIGLASRDATVTISPGLCGDADGNDVVNIVDALAIARKLVNLPPPPTVDVTLADTNKNGRLDINDALFIARYSVGLVLPPEVCAIGQPL